MFFPAIKDVKLRQRHKGGQKTPSPEMSTNNFQNRIINSRDIPQTSKTQYLYNISLARLMSVYIRIMWYKIFTYIIII